MKVVVIHPTRWEIEVKGETDGHLVEKMYYRVSGELYPGYTVIADTPENLQRLAQLRGELEVLAALRNELDQQLLKLHI